MTQVIAAESNWTNVSMGDVSESISEGCSYMGTSIGDCLSGTAGALQSCSSTVIDCLSATWNDNIGPCMQNIMNFVSTHFWAACDWVGENKEITYVALAAATVGAALTCVCSRMFTSSTPALNGQQL